MSRTALVILAGDVGTGKTELAETVGDPLAWSLGTKVTLFPLSLSARGHGAAGEMACGQLRSAIASPATMARATGEGSEPSSANPSRTCTAG